MPLESTTRRRLLAAALPLAVAAAGLASARARADDATVKIDNFTFEPEQLTVKVGATVTWINEDDSPHTVVASAHAFKSKALDTDDKFSFTFTAPGSYEYFCSLHPHMKAMVTVVGGQMGELRK
jgi:plastocyanin